MLIGYYGSFQIHIVRDSAAEGGEGDQWICTCPRGNPDLGRHSRTGRRRRRGEPRLYPCNHLIMIWWWARERGMLDPRLRLTSPDGVREARNCKCGPLEVPEDQILGESKPLEQQPPSSLRNRPCPCDSGWKFKECHGARAEGKEPKPPKRPPKVPQNEPLPPRLIPEGIEVPAGPAPPTPPGPPPAPPKPPPVAPPPGPPPKPPGPPGPPKPPPIAPLPPDQEERRRERAEKAAVREELRAQAAKRTRRNVDRWHEIDDRRKAATKDTRKARELEIAAGRKRSAAAKAARAEAEKLREHAAKLRERANKLAAQGRAEKKRELAAQQKAKEAKKKAAKKPKKSPADKRKARP